MFAGSLLDHGSIEMRDREIMILRTCARCNSEYEWGVHVALFSERAGLSKKEVAATHHREPANDAWSPRDMSLIRLADELHDQSTVSDSTWASLTTHYTEEQMLELIALAGYYHAIAFVTNAARVDLESFAPRFEDQPA
jgi:alkylhydroperoxidase family enzyme